VDDDVSPNRRGASDFGGFGGFDGFGRMRPGAGVTATILTGAKVVTPDGILDDASVRIKGDRIAAVGPHPESESVPDTAGSVAGKPVGQTLSGEIRVDLSGRRVVPGYVDLHVHGGGGASYSSGDEDEARRVAQFHLAHGTTTSLASLVSASMDDLVRQVTALVPLVEDGTVAGIHLEGPYISPARRGAHDPAVLREPSLDELDRLLDASHGTIRMITLAPELPGALPFIEKATARGVVAAIGHTDATYAQTRDGIAAGARVGTHLFNAMRGIHHREPGPIPALIEAPEVIVELINDGVHVHEAVARLVANGVGLDRLALVTDAMAATGVGDGTYRLGSMTVRVENGVARLAGGGAIAGSTLTMDAAFRRSVDSVGLPLPAAARAAATAPSRALGLEAQIGAIAHGLRADLVVLNADLTVARVMRAGRWVSSSGLAS
jgi:N-acetylglucosamine-6-phosphate deacetylase